jgi:tRNA wybutosine-synthesizing protein 3
VEVLEIAREAGLKHSGILSLSSKGIIVELMSGVRLTILLRDGDVRVVEDDRLGEVVSVANEALLEGKKRLDALRNALRRRAVT